MYYIEKSLSEHSDYILLHLQKMKNNCHPCYLTKASENLIEVQSYYLTINLSKNIG